MSAVSWALSWAVESGKSFETLISSVPKARFWYIMPTTPLMILVKQHQIHSYNPCSIYIFSVQTGPSRALSQKTSRTIEKRDALAQSHRDLPCRLKHTTSHQGRRSLCSGNQCAQCGWSSACSSPSSTPTRRRA